MKLNPLVLAGSLLSKGKKNASGANESQVKFFYASLRRHIKDGKNGNLAKVPHGDTIHLPDKKLGVVEAVKNWLEVIDIRGKRGTVLDDAQVELLDSVERKTLSEGHFLEALVLDSELSVLPHHRPVPLVNTLAKILKPVLS